MIDKVYPMTQEGKKKLEDELDQLKTKKRIEIIERIKVARSFGDLSENSEYEAAKDEQAFIEGRIINLTNMIRFAQIIDNKSAVQNEVSLGKTVIFQELSDRRENEEYTIVGTAESDPCKGKISNDSPMAKALMGKKIGDTVKVISPDGDIFVKIIDIK